MRHAVANDEPTPLSAPAPAVTFERLLDVLWPTDPAPPLNLLCLHAALPHDEVDAFFRKLPTGWTELSRRGEEYARLHAVPDPAHGRPRGVVAGPLPLAVDDRSRSRHVSVGHGDPAHDAASSRGDDPPCPVTRRGAGGSSMPARPGRAAALLHPARWRCPRRDLVPRPTARRRAASEPAAAEARRLVWASPEPAGVAAAASPPDPRHAGPQPHPSAGGDDRRLGPFAPLRRGQHRTLARHGRLTSAIRRRPVHERRIPLQGGTNDDHQGTAR